jgi:hypothetical protein
MEYTYCLASNRKVFDTIVEVRNVRILNVLLIAVVFTL